MKCRTTDAAVRSARHVRQRVHDLGAEMQRIHQRVLRVARMDRDALDVHLGLVRRERLVDDLAELGAVERVREFSLQVTW